MENIQECQECKHDHVNKKENNKEDANITTFSLGDENHPVDENDEVL
jgi:hypothetical protein